MKSRILSLLLVFVLALAGVAAVSAQDAAGTVITLNGASAMVEGEGAVVDGGLITISAGGTYSFSGTLDDGQILVDTEGDVTLILNGVNLNSSTSAPINIVSAESATIVLADGSENFVTDAAEYVYPSADVDEPNAAVFSNDDLVIQGNGSLTVMANYDDAISTDDSLTINDAPVITVNAADDAVRGKDELVINGGTFTLNAAGGDGLKSDNEDDADMGNLTVNGGTFVITAGDDGAQATTTATINGGDFTITAAGDGIHADWNLIVNDGSINILNSEEGLEAGFITLNDGQIRIVASDDGINVSEPDDIPNPTLYMLTINGGWIVVDAGGDGLDSNGSIAMNGGTVLVNGPTANMDGALDYDGTFLISGGVLVAAGSAGMPSSPNDTSSQNSVLVVFDAVQPAGTLVSIVSADGEEVVTFAPAKEFQALVVSSPALVQGTSYTVYTGGSHSGTATDGLYSGGAYTPGTEAATFTVESAVTRVGNVQMGGRGGRGGGRPGGQG